MNGWFSLLRLALRRDRVLLPVWVAALVVSCAGSAQATLDLYPDEASRVEAAHGVNDNPALSAFYGPIADVHSLGGIATFKLLLLGGVFVALLCVVLVRRHTRLEEESGRAELLAATAIGRHAALTAAVVEGVLASVATGVLTGAGNMAAGLEVGGSVAFGLAWAGIGLSATGITALAAQLSASTRTVGGIVASVLGASYVVRAAGDLSAGWLTWLSPFGWVTRLQPYGAERWWVALLPVLLLAATVTGAVALERRRDLGNGLLAARPGPARGRIGSVSGLVVRLQRSGTIGWLLGLTGLGAVLGGIAPAAGDFVGSQATQDLLERLGGRGRLVDTFLATEFSFVAVAVTAYAVTVIARAASEEDAGRTEEVLATSATRHRLLGSVTLLAGLGPALLMAGVGVGAALSFGPQDDGIGPALRHLLPAALAPLPAVWVITGATLLLFGLRRSWATLGWALLGACLLLGQVGALLGLPRWVVDLSPYGHVPTLPTEDFALGPELVLTLIAAVFAMVAFWRYRARDIG